MPPPTPARWSRSTRSTSRRARPRPASAGCSCASRRASRPRRTRRSAPATAARSSASTRKTRSSRSPRHAQPGSRSRDCTCTSARSSRTAAPTWRQSPTLGEFAARCRDELDWTPALVDVGGGFGIRHVEDEPEPPVEELVRSIADAVASEWAARGLAGAAASSSSPAARSSAPPRSRSTASARSSRRATRRYVAIDGGMSDNPRPQLYDARYSALLANRADEEPADGHFTIAGKHCESGDELIERARAARAPPRRSARGPGHRRLHARDELELQRRPAAGRRAGLGRGGAR